MHLPKRLVFQAVDVMACYDVIIPLQDRLDKVSGDFGLEKSMMLMALS